MSDTISTEKLQLVIGVPKSVGDLRSAEQGIRVFPLVLSGYSGFGISPANPWQPAMPALKDQWHESRLQDGRSLAGVAVENVTETVELKAVAGSRLELESRINELSRFINQARSFFATFYQIEPVYIEWSALGGKGSQYALIYNIEMSKAYNYPGTGEDGMCTVTLVIEREPAWRGVPPGVSPRVWTYYSRGLLPGADYDYVDLDPSESSLPSLAEKTVQNRNEYAVGTDDGMTPSVSQNWIDIDAEDIPGDAPALCMIEVEFGELDVTTYDLHIARVSKPLTVTARDPDVANGTLIRGRPLTVNFCDQDLLAATNDATWGVKRADSSSQQVLRIAGAASGTVTVFPNEYNLSLNAMRGRYNVFVRGRYNAGSSGATCRVRVQAINTNSDEFIGGDSFVALQNQSSGDTISLTYLGQLTLPLSRRQNQGVFGAGLLYGTDAAIDSLFFSLGYDIPGSTTFDFIDLLLIPFDEDALLIRGTAADATDEQVVIDTSDYLSRGRGQAHAQSYTGVNLTGFQGSVETTGLKQVIGSSLTLIPRVDNRIAFFLNQSAGQNFDVAVNIVPRWYGVRDS